MPDPPLAAFVDDVSLDGEVGLIRRISLGDSEIGIDGSLTVKGTAFQLQKDEVAVAMGYPRGCISLALESDVLATADGLESLVQGRWSGYALARLSAAQFRTLGFGLQRVPELEDPWHVVAFHATSKSQARKAQTPLAIACEVVLKPS